MRRRRGPPVGPGNEVDARAHDVVDRPAEALDGGQRLTHRCRRLRAGVTDVERAANPFLQQLAGTELGQAVHMLAELGDVQEAIDVGCSITAAIDEISRARGIRFVCVYLPPPLEGQPEVLGAERAEALALAELTDADVAAGDRIAAGWLAFLAARGIEHVDLRPAWRAARERLYWRADSHLNLAGQRALAAALLPLFDEP